MPGGRVGIPGWMTAAAVSVDLTGARVGNSCLIDDPVGTSMADGSTTF